MRTMRGIVATVALASAVAPTLAFGDPALDTTPVAALVAATPALVKIPTKIRVPPTVAHYRLGNGTGAIDGYVDVTEAFATRGLIATGQTVVAVPMSSGRELGPTRILVWTSTAGSMKFVGYVPKAGGDLTAKISDGYLVIDTAFDRARFRETCATSHRLDFDSIHGIALTTVRTTTLEGACTQTHP